MSSFHGIDSRRLHADTVTRAVSNRSKPFLQLDGTEISGSVPRVGVCASSVGQWAHNLRAIAEAAKIKLKVTQMRYAAAFTPPNVT